VEMNIVSRMEGEFNRAVFVPTAVLVDVSMESLTEETAGVNAQSLMPTIETRTMQNVRESEPDTNHQVLNLNFEMQYMMDVLMGKMDQIRQDLIQGNIELKQDLMGRMDRMETKLKQDLMGILDQDMLEFRQVRMQNRLEFKEDCNNSSNRSGQAFESLSEKITIVSEGNFSEGIIESKVSVSDIQVEPDVSHKVDIHDENKVNDGEICIPGKEFGSIVEVNYPDSQGSVLQGVERLIQALRDSKGIARAVKENKWGQNRHKFMYRGENVLVSRYNAVEVFKNTDLPIRKHQKWKLIDIHMLGRFFATMFRGGGFIEWESQIKSIEQVTDDSCS
jgi:hypothetical protein